MSVTHIVDTLGLYLKSYCVSLPLIRTVPSFNLVYCFGDGARRMDSVSPSDTLRMIHHDASGKLIQMQCTTTHLTAAIVSQPRYAATDDDQYNIRK